MPLDTFCPVLRDETGAKLSRWCKFFEIEEPMNVESHTRLEGATENYLLLPHNSSEGAAGITIATDGS